MAIQGTQVPIYTNTHFFFIFLIFKFFFIEKQQKKKKKTEKQPNKNIKKHIKHKARLTQKQESKNK